MMLTNIKNDTNGSKSSIKLSTLSDDDSFLSDTNSDRPSSKAKSKNKSSLNVAK